MISPDKLNFEKLNGLIPAVIVDNNTNAQEVTDIGIFNIQGIQLIQDRFRNQHQFEMNISTLAKGIYLVKIETRAGIESKKLVIE